MTTRPPRRTRITIAGVRTLEDALAAADAGADAIAFDFVPDAPRAISPEDAYDILARLPPLVATIAIFRDACIDEFSDAEEVCPTAYSQLRGQENDKLVRSCGPGVFKAIRFDPATTPGELARFDAIEEVDAIVVDAQDIGIDAWRALGPMLVGVSKPIVLAGGLTPRNVGQAISLVRPWAVEAALATPGTPGLNDARAMEDFCEAVRRGDARPAPTNE